MTRTAENTKTARRVVQTLPGMPTEDGAGVKLTRMIGTPQLPDLDPLLMLDVIRSDDPKGYIAGFPEHPHRGFETVSYMIKGSMQHRDSHGGKGLISDGGVQWMTAGRGVVHSEMPAQNDGALFGFQLWINLPAAEKMRDPWYRDIAATAIPDVPLEDGATARLIAGRWNGVEGPAPARATAPFIADVTIPAYGKQTIPLPDGHNAFAFVFQGSAQFGPEGEGTRVKDGEIAVLSADGALSVSAQAAGARFLVVAGKPLREPIAKYGPFVMNTAAEINAAISDYRAGRF
ncbi:MAG: pirin family protein [Alphaproteobacteria bacterium]|nr:pirin family protein [Alphaproteobacteria bacterium]